MDSDTRNKRWTIIVKHILQDDLLLGSSEQCSSTWYITPFLDVSLSSAPKVHDTIIQLFETKLEQGDESWKGRKTYPPPEKKRRKKNNGQNSLNNGPTTQSSTVEHDDK